MTIIKPSEAFPSANWSSGDVRAFHKDQTPLAVDTVQDVRDNDFESTRWLYVKAKGVFYRLNPSSTASDDGDAVLRDSQGRRYEKQGGGGAVSSVNGQTGAVVLNIREKLTADRTYYVRTDGSDSNDGQSNSSGGAFLTLARAEQALRLLDLAGYTATVQIVDGTYTAGVTITGPYVGGNVIWKGNSATPANVLVNTTSDCFIVQDGAVTTVKDMELRSSSGYALRAQRGAAVVKYGNLRFGACGTGHLLVTDIASAVCESNYTISGSTNYHMYLGALSVLRVQSTTVTLSGTPNFASDFVRAEQGAVALITANTFSGSATGRRYNAAQNGIVMSGGAGATYLPGNTSGTTSTGGQYI